jgi:hypothetical protein
VRARQCAPLSGGLEQAYLDYLVVVAEDKVGVLWESIDALANQLLRAFLHDRLAKARYR